MSVSRPANKAHSLSEQFCGMLKHLLVHAILFSSGTVRLSTCATPPSSCRPCDSKIASLYKATGETYQLEYIYMSDFSTHAFYRQTLFGIPLWNCGIACHVMPDTVILDLHIHPIDGSYLIKARSNANWYLPRSNILIPVLSEYRFDSSSGNAKLEFLSESGQIVRAEETLRFQDKSVPAYVFSPNPIHSSGSQYGDEYSDRNDAMYQALRTQMVQIDIQLAGGIPIPEFIKLQDRSPPNQNVLVNFEQDLPPDRSDPTFEIVQVLYHIGRFVEHLRNLGFKDLIHPVQIDPHALAGADRSAFDPFAEPPSIQFGVGGVDDAEDAQVIIHEYVHALVHQITPFSYSGSHRQIIEEALCDYFALSYSFLISAIEDAKVFSWDGHNEFWDGYTARLNYIPCDENDPVCQRENWTGIFYQLALNNSFGQIDRIVLELIPFLMADSSNEAHAHRLLWLCKELGIPDLGKLRTQLIRSGFLDENYIRTISPDYSNAIRLYGEDLLVELQDFQVLTWELLDLNGRHIAKGTVQGKELLLSESVFGGIAGAYWIVLNAIKNEGIRPKSQIFRILYTP